MPKESFVFYVYDKCNNGFYADDIRMYPEWESINYLVFICKLLKEYVLNVVDPKTIL
jgi:hypothetical protein